MALEQRLIEQLKAEHGSAAHIYIPETKFDEALDIIVKRPPRAEWKRFRTMLFDPAQKADAMETLARACVIHPAPSDFAALLVTRPALAEKVGSEVAEMAGGGGEAETKKL